MKTILTSFLITVMAATAAQADCAYFRTASRLVSCSIADPKTIAAGDMYAPASDVPELEETATKILVQVSCECDYSLMGSDLRCELDQTIERSSILGAENLSTTCRRGRSLCSDACPPRLP